MAVEQYTESLTLREMRCAVGDNGWGFVLTVYDAELLKKAKDIILEPKNYIKLFNGENLQKDYSIDKIRATAIEMHDCLRKIAVREKHKPIFIAGVLT
ncbi:MAG: hypothetical protein LBB74_02295 [Chitinispirillales bacterium]|jgi:hypothetical protein|nr:hypothetical protein [Chitinispirillales bacterium]